ncbi:MAG: Hpt domain-containing protein, partial [Bacteroidota bacterium]
MKRTPKSKIQNLNSKITMIEDNELRDLFKIECAEHLQRLSDGLLRLEKNPKDLATLEEVFREAHSLKGAARMVGVADIEILAHRFEDILGMARRGETALASNTIDRLYQGLDAIGKLMNEAVAGEAAGIKVTDILALLTGEDTKKSDVSPSVIDLTSKIQAQAVKIEKPAVAEELKAQTKPSEIEEKSKIQSPKSKIENAFKIDTIRVDTGRLDALMTQVGELSVTKARVARRISEIEEIIETWEKLNKDILEFGIWNLDLKSKFQNLKLNQLGILLGKLKNAADEDYSKFDYVAGELESGIRTIRLLPLSTIF